MTYDSEQISCPICDGTEFENIWLVTHDMMTATCMCCGSELEIQNTKEGSYILQTMRVRL